MNHTTPVGDWEADGLCKRDTADLFFPDGETSQAALTQISKAQAICGICPVMGACQDWALDNRIEYGVWGGLSEAERRRIHRRNARPGTFATAAPVRYATVAAALAARSTAEDGHTLWQGSLHFTIDGVRYVARRAAFQELHGRAPAGPVTTTCDQSQCLTHLEDRLIRERCGTTAGYRRHHTNGDDPCQRCKDANAAADRRLNDTGTTKVLVG